jgi:hypothetical protein
VGEGKRAENRELRSEISGRGGGGATIGDALIPSAADIVTSRWRLAAWLRVFALGGMIFAIPALMSWLAEGLRDDDLWDYGYYAGRMILSVGGAIVGALVFVLAPVLSCVLLPVPPATECPRCRYALAGAGGGRCPECGLPVGEAFIGSAIDPGDRRRRARSRLLDEITPAAVLLGGLWSLVLAALIVVSVTRELGIAGFVMGAMLSAPIVLSHMLALRLGARGGRADVAAGDRASEAPAATPAPDAREA